MTSASAPRMQRLIRVLIAEASHREPARSIRATPQPPLPSKRVIMATRAATTVVAMIAFVGLSTMAEAQPVAKAEAWKDPSPHMSQFISVGQDVRLEVLDWGGAG